MLSGRLGVYLWLSSSKEATLSIINLDGPRRACCADLMNTNFWLQGGKEATLSNAILHRLIVDAVAEEAPAVGRDLIGLVTSREAVDDLLKLHDVIDLVIPRGSNSLVGVPMLYVICWRVGCFVWV